MPGRRIPVKLDLEAAGYIAEARKVETSTKVMDASMGALDREVDKVDRSMAELAVTTEAAKRQVDDLGDKSRGTAADLSLLDARIKATRLHVRELGLEFARTGDKAAGQNLGRERSLLGRLEKLRKELSDLDESIAGAGAGAGVRVTNDFGQQLGGAFSGGGGGRGGLMAAVIGALVGAAVLAAPTVGAILAGGIAGALGTGALAVGILAASKDERVRAAAQSFGQDLSAEFFGSGQAFVEPVIKSLGILQKAFGDIHLGESLAKLAPEVTVIAEGFAEAAREFMPGFNKALDRMGPLADVAAHGIADMGQALGEALDDITASKGTLEGLKFLFGLLNGTVRVIGVSLEWLGNVFHRLNAAAGAVFGGLEDIFAKLGLDKLSDMAARANDNFEALTGTGESMHGMFRRLGTEAVDPFAGYLHHAWEEQQRLREETEATNKALQDYWTTLRGIDDANIAWEQAVDDLTQSIKDNGTSLDIGTQKGRDNARAVLEGIDAAKHQYEQGKITSAQYDEQIQKLIDIGVKAGMSRQELEELAGKYEIQIVVTAIVPAVKGAIDLVGRAMQSIFAGRAAAGPVYPGVPYVVGEHGPEIAMFGQQGQMYSNAQSVAMAQQWGTAPAMGSALPPVNITVQLVDSVTGRVTRQQLITDALNRGQPGSVVAAAYP